MKDWQALCRSFVVGGALIGVTGSMAMARAQSEPPVEAEAGEPAADSTPVPGGGEAEKAIAPGASPRQGQPEAQSPQEGRQPATEPDVDSQSAADPAAAPPEELPPAPSDGIEVITVTAQKRPENLQDVPISIATLNGDEIDYMSAAGADIQFLSARLPSLTIESSFGRTFPRFYIRGLGNTDFDLNASQPVSMILDGIVLENPTVKGFPIFDMDRVEVLRGPQGTLFGRNTPAGIIKFESNKPTFDPEGYGRLSYGQFDFVGFEGAVSGPIIENILATRASLLYERRGGWVDNEHTNKKNALEGFADAAGRFQLLFTPTDSISALLNVHAHSLDGTARVFRANVLKKGSNHFVEDFDHTKVWHDGKNEQRINQIGSALSFEWDFGPVTLVSLTGYEHIEVFSRGDIDGGFGSQFAPPFGPGLNLIASESADGIPDLNQLTEELRVATNDWQWVNFQSGLFFFYEDLDSETISYDSTSGGGQNGYAEQHQESIAFAAFASATVDPIDDLRVAGGIRYSHDEKSFAAQRLTSPLPGVGSTPLLTANPKADFVSWDASVTYNLLDGLNLFVRGASGFRAPSIQGRVLFGDTISVAEGESILSFEIGTKTQLFANRARINLAGFFYELQNQQLTAVGGTANFNTLLNADKSLGYGIELDAKFLPVANLLINLGMSFNHTEIKDEDLALAPCGGGCTVTDPDGPTEGTVLINNNPLPHAPEWIVNASISYAYPVGEYGEIFAFTDWAFRSKINFFLYESKEFSDDWLLEGNLRLGYSYDEGLIEVAAFVRNITDDRSPVGGIDFLNLTAFINEPRVWGVEASCRF